MFASVATEPRRTRLRIGLGAAVVLLLVALASAVLMAAMAPQGQTQTVGNDEPVASAVANDPSGTTIFVHLLGAIEHPGLYELREGARAIDAVAAAGGFLETADQAQLNLARFVTDGEQIYVPATGEGPPPGAGGAVVAGKVNINTADAATLETLPRVGPVMAANIIQWRETNGRFAATEDLMSVTGIGDKTFEGLRDLVTV